MVGPKWVWVSAQDEFEVPALSEVTNGWNPVKPDVDTEVPKESEIFVREIVQNFMDAARDWQTGEALDKPKLTFQFVSVEGAEASRLRAELNLDSLAKTYEAIGTDATREMRINHSSQVFENSTAPLTLLVVREENTSGMYGPWQRSSTATLPNGLQLKRKMAKAFLSHSRDYATSGRGLGSFGEGKKAIINISRPKSILAYTAFDPSLTDDGAWSRFVGITFWQDFILEEKLFSGLAMMGDDFAGGLRPDPYTNEDATFIIEKLRVPGLETRKHECPEDWGTTLVFIDPTITPNDCAEAIVRNWWPLIDADEAEFEIFDGDGQVQLPDLPSVRPFRNLARRDDTSHVNNWLEATGPAVETKEVKVKTCSGDAGKLVLAVDMRPSVGFSMQNEDENRSQVALVREGMVVHYEPINEGRSKDRPPFVRGVFEVNRVSHPESEDLLRKTEPPLHNEWRGAYKANEEAAKHARSVMSAIKSMVGEIKEKYRKTSLSVELDLVAFGEAFALRSKAGVQDPPPPRLPRTLFTVSSEKLDLTETEDHRREAHSTQTVKLSGLGIQRAELEGQAHLEVVVTIGWEVLEDGRFVPAFDAGSENVAIPDHFEALGEQTYTGKVSTRAMEFSWSSPPYDEPWSIKPAITVALLEAEERGADGN